MYIHIQLLRWATYVIWVRVLPVLLDYSLIYTYLSLSFLISVDTKLHSLIFSELFGQVSLQSRTMHACMLSFLYQQKQEMENDRTTTTVEAFFPMGV